MFAMLDIKSAFSFLDGTMSIQEIVQTAKSFNYAAIAVNDRHTMHGAMALRNISETHNIKPLYSLRVTLVDHDHITYLIYAKNNQGYRDLLAFSTFLESSDTNVEYKDVVKYSKDCVIVVYGEGGIIESNQIDTLFYLNLYKESLDDFYIGISNNNSNKWKVDNDNLKLLCASLNIKTVALPKVEFRVAEDAEVKKLFVAMNHNRSFSDHQNYVNEKNYFLSIDEIKKYYDPKDIEHTVEIANKCNVDFRLMEKATLPIFETPNEMSSEDYLNNLTLAGLKRRLNNNVSRIYLDRLKYELSVINSMGYADYFLIVYDTILYARNHDIYVGPGRGSSASSLVAYVLGITHIDPIENDLLFERFLNPERISLPDIDIDFPDDKRDEIIAYVTNKYGYDHVAQIVTYGTFAARQSLRDVGKALNIPTYKLDQLSKLIASVPNTTLKMTYDDNKKFRKMIDEDTKLKELYRLASKIEGLPRHTSLHAAGIVMSKNPIATHLPLSELSDGTYVTQYSMNYLEDLGLNKIDFLGLRNLSIIAEICSNFDGFDILKIPLDDQKTFELLQKGDTSGIFQLESYGMTKLFKGLQPHQFTDIVAAIALYRPGPVKNIPAFLENRNNPENIKYIHDDLSEILNDTYGIIIYQEQIMQIAQLMANFSLAKADILRKAMSSKQSDLLHSLREEFIEESVKNGYQRKTATEIYDLIEEFSNYGFNKAHSYAYGLIAYQMAYLKANHYLEFYLALLNGVIGSPRKTSEYVSASKKVGINIFGPNINYSHLKFVKNNNSILFPLLSIKSVGQAVSTKLLQERQNGPFIDFFDFVARANLAGISKAVMEALIYAGALDTFKHNRTTLIYSLDQALMYANLVKVDADVPSLDFDIVSKPQIIKYESDKFKELEMEKEYLGFYLSTHPIEQYKKDMDYKGDDIVTVKQLKKTKYLLVYVTKVKTHRTKFGDLMAFIEVVDENDTIDLVVMPNVYKLVEDKLKVNTYISISGKIDRKESILVDSMTVK